MGGIVVIDYGMGNLHSVHKALDKVAAGQVVTVSSDVDVIRRADRVVFPGVGAMRDCMAELKRLALDELIREVAREKPFLAVCVGMQALLDHSEENEGVDCLGLISGNVLPFEKDMTDPVSGERLKVPHMGWNQVNQLTPHPMWRNIPQDSRFYFVHSYFVQPATPTPVVASSVYGFPFASALAQENIFAVQFHPEKSQHAGLTLYANFVQWDGH